MTEWIREALSETISGSVHIMPYMQAVLFLCLILHLRRPYKRGSYYKVTKTPYSELRKDPGRMGEYLIYKRLRFYERRGARFLFNCYLPGRNGATTEVDALMIHESGIYVLESKNYSGWIFGNEAAEQWTQVLAGGRGNSRKEHFFNPVMQNRGHMKYIKDLIGHGVPVHSVIVFSDRCVLKEIEVWDKHTHVTTVKHLRGAVRRIRRQTAREWSGFRLSREETERLYEALYPFSQTTKRQRKKHVKKVRKRIRWYAFRRWFRRY